MIDSLFNLLFSCAHNRTSFPLTPTRGAKFSPVAGRTGTYVVCLDCGKEFPYDWNTLRIERPQRERRPTAAKKAGAWLLQPLLRFRS